MRRRGLILLAIGSLTVSISMVADRASATDEIALPPGEREFRSPGGNFLLTIQNVASGADRGATAELVAISGPDKRVIWRRKIPHEQGPRLALVTDNGTVILFDEWINVPSVHALMLIGPDNSILADYSFDQLVERLKVPRRDMTTHAKLGPWLSDTPHLRDGGRAVQMHAAGRMLVLSIADGQLSVVQ